MRKIIIGAVAVVGMLLFFSGCDSSSSSGSSGGNTPQNPVEFNIYVDKDMGLMWQDDTNSATIRKPWLEQAQYNACADDSSSGACVDTSGDTGATYCSNMVLGGYTDWRLATEEELTYLGNSNQYLNLKNYKERGIYWTSTSSTTYNISAISVFMSELQNKALTKPDWKIQNFYIRCTRNI